jgi:hypothetical protein
MDTGKCCECGAETSLFVNDAPVCIACDAKRDGKAAFPIPMRAREAKKPDENPESNSPKARFAAA